jgi:hypothetical protein
MEGIAHYIALHYITQCCKGPDAGYKAGLLEGSESREGRENPRICGVDGAAVFRVFVRQEAVHLLNSGEQFANGQLAAVSLERLDQRTGVVEDEAEATLASTSPAIGSPRMLRPVTTVTTSPFSRVST